MPIRIMHVLDNMGRGGMQNGLVNLIDHLNPCHFEHIVCSTRHLEDEYAHSLPAERVRSVCVGPKEGHSRVQVSALARAIRKFRPDIVHSRNWGGVEAVPAGRIAGVPAIIHSEHGLDPDTVETEPWRRVAFRRLAFELADRVMCVSNQLKQLYSRRTRFPENQMIVIHNGVDTRRFGPDPLLRAAARRDLGLSAGEFCVGCVGRLSPIKDYPTVFRAASILQEAVTDWRVLLVGSGPEQAALEAFLRDRPGCGRRVMFLGLRNDIGQLLNAMDVYVLASVTEGISNSLLEAMAAGLPVVATATGGNPEVVEDRESGILFPVGDFESLAGHLQRLYFRPEERAKLGSQALRRIQKRFSLEAMVRNYEDLYLSVVPQPKQRSREVACN